MNTILQRSFKERRSDMTPMKAQKMLFFTHGWHLAITGQPAIDRTFEAWRYGPVVEVIYQDLKSFGSAPVTSYIKEGVEGKAFVVNPEWTALYESLDVAWEKYIGFRAETLSTLTHEDGTPWALARKAGRSQISDDTIKTYFADLART